MGFNHFHKYIVEGNDGFKWINLTLASHSLYTCNNLLRVTIDDINLLPIVGAFSRTLTHVILLLTSALNNFHETAKRFDVTASIIFSKISRKLGSDDTESRLEGKKSCSESCPPRRLFEKREEEEKRRRKKWKAMSMRERHTSMGSPYNQRYWKQSGEEELRERRW